MLPLLAVLFFGNCSQNVYRVLGPGTTPVQVARLRQLTIETYAAYHTACESPGGAAGPTIAQVVDSSQAAQQRLLSSEQYHRYRARQLVLPLRYPKHPPRRYR